MSLLAPSFLQPLLRRPIAVLGAGVSGRGVLALLARLGVAGEVFARDGGGRTEFGPEDAAHHPLVIFSPGFPPDHPWLEAARSAGGLCLGELDFASLFWRGSLVAITGTNGKTTTTEFLVHALRSLGRDAHGVGNVGRSFAGLVAELGGGAPDSLAVCEVSSFQAETLHYLRADAALWTNLAEDHLERHGSLRAYFMAKWRLFERTIGGQVFAGSSVQRHAESFGQTLPAEACVATEDQPADVLLQRTVFAHCPQRENFLLAAAWWRSAGWPEGRLYAAAQSFVQGPHRLTRVGEYGGATWWNDSKATNFHAVEGALANFSSPVFLLAGGKAKGGDIEGFVRRISPRVKRLLAFGETASALAAACERWEVPYALFPELGSAVAAAAGWVRAGDHVLLSPGFSSFDQFRDYQDRGLQFERLVNDLEAPARFGVD